MTERFAALLMSHFGPSLHSPRLPFWSLSEQQQTLLDLARDGSVDNDPRPTVFRRGTRALTQFW
jgi:hypothetical protein